MRKDTSLIMGTIAAHVGLFLVISFTLAISFSIVFIIATTGFARLTEWQYPGSLETPLSGLGPLLEAGFTTVLLHICILAVLAWKRIRMMKFFLMLISLVFVSLIAAWYIGLGVLQYSKGWYPVWRTPVREYPVLVVTPDQRPGLYHAQIVLWGDLENFCRENPQYSFLVPEGQDSDLHSQMPNHDFQWAIAQKGSRENPVSARFDVTRLGNGRQKIVVSGSWYRNSNASVQSWYEAEAHKIYPKYMIEGDTWGYYLHGVWILMGLVDLILLGFYLRHEWKKIQWPCESAY
jgi:hypothetical protein